MGKTRRSGPRISRNDPCWCGSGRKYKYCHLNRHLEAPLPRGQLRDMIDRRFGGNKTCLHPDAPTGCGRVIRSHTLQRSGIIKSLVGSDNHVRTFHPLHPGPSEILKIHHVGWREASTFFGFCDRHDGQLFSAIENQPFVGSEKQIFLIGYRALCHELYQKQAAMEVDPVLMANLDRGLPGSEQMLIQRQLACQSAGGLSGLREVRSLKRTYDEILRGEDYSMLHSAVLWFRNSPCVASTGTVHVDFDLHGKRLQNLGRDPGPIHGLTFGVVSTPDGNAFAATWLAAFDKCDDFINSLLTFDREAIPSLLAEFFFAYVENTYFSEAWWSALPEPNQRRLMHLAGNPIQYGNPLRYSGLCHGQWELAQADVRLR